MADAYSLFGFEIKRKKKQDTTPSVIAPVSDGAIINAASSYGIAVDYNDTNTSAILKSEIDLIKQYRAASFYSDCDTAIDHIISEAIIADPDGKTVTLVLDDVEKLSESIKDKIRDEFDTILRLYNFSSKGYDMFRQWYIDGRLYYHIILDDKNPKDGVKEIRFIDPRKIKKVKNVKYEKNKDGVDVVKEIDEYFAYNDHGVNRTDLKSVRLSTDSVVYATSGLVDANSGMVLGYLQKAIKPTNQLKMMEDALVIYRVSRAPERRVFYVDVGNLPKQRAEQYVNDLMNRFRNKIVYDANTGEVRDNKQHLSMMEDFWMPRREGGKGTEITNLPGGQNLGDIEDIKYFQQKLLQALNVPAARMKMDEQNSPFSVGRSNEITREEVRFSKFIERLRMRFSQVFRDALRVQLIAKSIINADEWDKFCYDIRFDYQRDNYFAELKEAEIIQNRVNTLQNVEPYIGKFYSPQWAKKNILMQTEEETIQMDKEIAEFNKAISEVNPEEVEPIQQERPQQDPRER